MLTAVLAATRWPVLDLLAAVEKHLLRDVQSVSFKFAHGWNNEDCLAPRSAFWKDVAMA